MCRVTGMKGWMEVALWRMKDRCWLWDRHRVSIPGSSKVATSLGTRIKRKGMQPRGRGWEECPVLLGLRHWGCRNIRQDKQNNHAGEESPLPLTCQP